MGASSEISDLLSSMKDVTSLGARVGKVVEWSSSTSSFIVDVGGTPISAISMLATATMTSVLPGDSVMVMRYQDTFIIVGRIVPPGGVQPEPNLAIPMVPAFTSGSTPNTPSLYAIGSATQTEWHGYARITHPKLAMVAILGQYTGSGQSVPFTISISGVVVASFTVTTLTSQIWGPWDISSHIATGVQLIQVQKLAATAGTGQTGFHIYSVYQRSY